MLSEPSGLPSSALSSVPLELVIPRERLGHDRGFWGVGLN